MYIANNNREQEDKEETWKSQRRDAICILQYNIRYNILSKIPQTEQ